MLRKPLPLHAALLTLTLLTAIGLVAGTATAQTTDSQTTDSRTSAPRTGEAQQPDATDPATALTPDASGEPAAPAAAQANEGAAAAPVDNTGQGEGATPASELAEPVQEPRSLPQVNPAAQGLYVEFGRGVRLQGEDDNFSLTIRGRVQSRMTVNHDGDETDTFFQVRRARLVLLGALPRYDLEMYVQLGVGASDLERDAPVPLRDAVITWTGHRDLSLRVGQMKVPFNRERIISSSALQLADRSLSNAELNLDRDVGVQLFSNDLFGLDGRLGYQVGIYGGDGRNRIGTGSGMLYVGRIQINPFGEFIDSLSEADLTRSRTPRLSIGVAGGYNVGTRRLLSTHGGFYQLGGFDFFHVGGDLIFKWNGLSLQAELLYRGSADPLRSGEVDGQQIDELARVGLGYMVQAGYLFASGFEVSGRWSEVLPVADQRSALVRIGEVHGGLGYYWASHNLKLQSDYGIRFTGEELGDLASHEARVQLQFFF